jgi:hypothetical protein
MTALSNALANLNLCLLLVACVALSLILTGWLAGKAIEALARAFKIQRMVCEYVWHRHQFKHWLAQNCHHGAKQ